MFNVPANAKLLVATLSSHDELFAAQQAGFVAPAETAFPSQIEWIDWLADYVAQRQDLFLLIRVHPREFPNKREIAGIVSDNARRLQAHLADLPPNCAVNWPSQKVSLYDLAKEADIFLNAWSSAGREMGLLGLPVVEWAAPLLLYEPQVDLCARDPADYGRKISLALQRGWNADAIRSMYRWCVLEYELSTFSSLRHAGRHPWSLSSFSTVLNKVVHRLSPYAFDAWMARRDAIGNGAVAAVNSVLTRQAATLASADYVSDVSELDESVALGSELRRVASALFGPDMAPTNRLHRKLFDFLSA
jgi:hypothetical protein